MVHEVGHPVVERRIGKAVPDQPVGVRPERYYGRLGTGNGARRNGHHGGEEQKKWSHHRI